MCDAVSHSHQRERHTIVPPSAFVLKAAQSFSDKMNFELIELDDLDVEAYQVKEVLKVWRPCHPVSPAASG